jgi:putative toxin-antitoxin system antitoxin component (TIGR02293 family)
VKVDASPTRSNSLKNAGQQQTRADRHLRMYDMAHMALARARHIADALGGRKVLKADLGSPKALLRGVESGLPYGSLDALIARFGLARADVADATRIPLRTLARRKQERKLRPDESDRLVRLARVAADAARVLGNEQKAGSWLRGSNVALGGERPIDLLRSDLGSRQVEDVLGRIEFGVHS